jgi:hypothetical protein
MAMVTRRSLVENCLAMVLVTGPHHRAGAMMICEKVHMVQNAINAEAMQLANQTIRKRGTRFRCSYGSLY